MSPEGFDDRMRAALGGWAAVDPERFREACDDLGLWDEGTPALLYETMLEEFGDDATSAAMRFLDLQESLEDGTLTEFQFSTDDGEVATPYAVLEAAAVAPLDEEGHRLDRPAWFAEIVRRLED